MERWFIIVGRKRKFFGAGCDSPAQYSLILKGLLKYRKGVYTKFTPIGAKNGAETKKSHNFKFHTAPEKLLLLRSFFHFS